MIQQELIGLYHSTTQQLATHHSTTQTAWPCHHPQQISLYANYSTSTSMALRTKAAKTSRPIIC